MRLDRALRLVHQLTRWQNGSEWRRSDRGRHLVNCLVPKASRHEVREAERVIRGPARNYRCVVRRIDPHDCVSMQGILNRKSLAWNLVNFHRKQRTKTVRAVDVGSTALPIVFELGEGRYAIWNGNHRTTAALLLGESLRCVVYRRRRPRC